MARIFKAEAENQVQKVPQVGKLKHNSVGWCIAFDTQIHYQDVEETQKSYKCIKQK